MENYVDCEYQDEKILLAVRRYIFSSVYEK